MTVQIENIYVNYNMLKYMSLYAYIDSITDISTDGVVYTITYTARGAEIAAAVEAHEELNLVYTQAMLDTVMVNAGLFLGAVVQKQLDLEAQTYGYDDIKSVRSWTGFANSVQAECITISNWCAACWDLVITISNDVKAGLRDIPTEAALIAELPAKPVI